MQRKTSKDVCVIILAAGLGTRMKSNKAKVLHEILGKPMIAYVLETAHQIAGDDIIVVVGHQAERVKDECLKVCPAEFALQFEQLGTGHAVMCAMPSVVEETQNVIILCGDVPLLSAETIGTLLADHRKHDRDLSLLAVEIDNPTGYGRVLIDQQRRLSRIVEEADATESEKVINLINTGIYCVDRTFLAEALTAITPDNAQGEFYLTDIIEIGYQNKKSMGVLIGESPTEVAGVNTVDDLKAVEILKSKS